jgi:hypothetical protein
MNNRHDRFGAYVPNILADIKKQMRQESGYVGMADNQI